MSGTSKCVRAFINTRSAKGLPQFPAIRGGDCLAYLCGLLLVLVTNNSLRANDKVALRQKEQTVVAENPRKPEPAEKKAEKSKPVEKPKAEKEDNAEAENPFPNRNPAPGLDGGKEWLNAAGEITLKDLRGKVVILDFWTYCCINCMHILPDLKYLEKKYDKELVVIGVHSAKFENEKESDNIRRAIMRYEIEHPVVNDAQMTIWRKFQVRSWPTLVLIDPEGFYCGYVAGEGNREVLDTVIGKLLEYHRAKKTLDESPVQFDLERGKAPATPLRFPGKVTVDEASQRLFISDSNHNRIVVASPDGKLRDVIGSGAIGKKDGSFAEAEFDHPQGLALDGETLYVADTENHLLRQVDLKQKTVTTLAGTGEQGNRRDPRAGLLKTALNSPWDLLVVKEALYICMAGPHQLWKLDFGQRSIEPYAGSGREDIKNGLLMESALAQPSGITTDGESLYVVDSEGSAVRKISLDPAGEVTTVVGSSDEPNGRCLFEFGDRDGIGDEVRLQHPLGIAYYAGDLFVADSYNHKIKKVDLKKQAATTFLGTGEAGDRDKPAQFSEPAGVAVSGGKLYIADTNNHRIQVADLKTQTVSTLEIAGLTPPVIKPVAGEDIAQGDKAVEVAPQVIASGDQLEIVVTLNFPEGYKLNKQAPATYRIQTSEEQELFGKETLGSRQELEVNENVAKLSLPLLKKTGKGNYRLAVTYGYCREGVGGLCKLKNIVWRLPIEVTADAKQTSIQLTAESSP